MIKVKEFIGAVFDDDVELDDQINIFLSERKVELLDVKYQRSISENYVAASALLIYRETQEVPYARN